MRTASARGATTCGSARAIVAADSAAPGIARSVRAIAPAATRREVISDLPFPANGGWVEVISGVMFSGKSEELIRRVRRAVIARRKVQVFKSHLDARYAGLFSVSSHDGV